MNYYNKLASRRIANDWCVRDTHPPTARALSVHLSLLAPSLPPPLPQSLPLWCYLWVCVSVGRRWRSVWLNPDKETNSSANRHTEEERGGGEAVCVGWWWWGGTKQNRQKIECQNSTQTPSNGGPVEFKAPSFSFSAAVPSKTHTCRRTTRLNLQEVLGPLSFLHIHEDGGPDIWSILTLINWWPSIKKFGTETLKFSCVIITTWNWYLHTYTGLLIQPHDYTVTMKARCNHSSIKTHLCSTFGRKHLIYSTLQTNFRNFKLDEISN